MRGRFDLGGTEGPLRLLHRARRAVRDLAAPDPVVLLAYATVFTERPSGAGRLRPLMSQVVDDVRDLAGRWGGRSGVHLGVRRSCVLRSLAYGEPAEFCYVTQVTLIHSRSGVMQTAPASS